MGPAAIRAETKAVAILLFLLFSSPADSQSKLALSTMTHNICLKHLGQLYVVPKLFLDCFILLFHISGRLGVV